MTTSLPIAASMPLTVVAPDLLRRASLGIMGCIALLGSTGGGASAQDIGSFFVSANYIIGDFDLHHNFTTHRVDDVGISAGFMLTIIDRKYDFHYKGAVAFHGVEDLEYGNDPPLQNDKFYLNLDQYVGSVHELLVGRRFNLGEKVYLHPLLGAGVLVNIIYGNGGEGLAWCSVQLEFSTQAMYRLSSFDLGLQLSFATVPWDTYLQPAGGQYITLGAVIAK